MDKGLIKKNENFPAYNNLGPMSGKGYPKGAYKIGRFTIKDDHQFKKHLIYYFIVCTYFSIIYNEQNTPKD